MVKQLLFCSAALAAQALVLASAVAQYVDNPETTQHVLKGRPYSPYADRAFPTNVYFGDVHVHTGLSTDAGGGGTRLMPRDAYRFARGEQVMSNTGQPVKLSRPLDFFMITDHSDAMGAITDIIDGAPAARFTECFKDLIENDPDVLLTGLEHLDERYIKAVKYSTKASKEGEFRGRPKMVLLADIASDDEAAADAAASAHPVAAGVGTGEARRRVGRLRRLPPSRRPGRDRRRVVRYGAASRPPDGGPAAAGPACQGGTGARGCRK